MSFLNFPFLFYVTIKICNIKCNHIIVIKSYKECLLIFRSIDYTALWRIFVIIIIRGNYFWVHHIPKYYLSTFYLLNKNIFLINECSRNYFIYWSLFCQWNFQLFRYFKNRSITKQTMERIFLLGKINHWIRHLNTILYFEAILLKCKVKKFTLTSST